MVTCIFIYEHTFVISKSYYCQIDNSLASYDQYDADMPWKYTLNGFDSEGKNKELKFNTDHKLKEEAYLKIEYMLIRGVIRWEVVELDNIPKNAREKLKD